MTDLRSSNITPLNLNELAQIAVSLQALVGAQLQDCVQSATEAGLGFYHDRKMVWLWFDLSPQRPLIVRFLNTPPLRKKIARPLTLFIKSRYVGRRLESVRADLSRGRVLTFSFFRAADEETTAPLVIEAHLIPHAANLIATDGKSTVAESKPKELPVQVFTEQRVEPIVRTWDEIATAWQQLQTAAVTKQANVQLTDAGQREKKYQKAVEKKRAALERMAEELALKTSGAHRELGEWLKAQYSLDVPDEWRELIDSKKSLSWNIEHAFYRAKENERKSAGTRARIAIVEAELQKLEKTGPAKFDLPGKGGAQKPNESLLARAAARGRRHQIASDLDVYIGKSASDNLALLRKAQAFDFWLHLRDHTGAHAILRRTRGRAVTDLEFQEAGRWVLEQSLGLRVKGMKGERFDLLIVECRYVRPIKGDKIGRVNYTNDRVMTIRY